MAIRDTCSITAPNVTGSAVYLRGAFNVTAAAPVPFTGAAVIERSYDGGATWFPIGYPDGAPLLITGALSVALDEPNANALYRVRGAAYAAGVLNVTVSQ
jgi:hypothetical protein